MAHVELRIGVVTPHTAAGPEVELPALARGRVAVEVSRVASAAEATAVAAAFERGSVDVVAFASTGSSYAFGWSEEAALTDALARASGVPAVSSGTAAVAALRRCGARRVLVVHPPWFDDDAHEMAVGYFGEQGLEVVLSRALGVPQEPGDVRPDHVVGWAARHLAAAAGGLDGLDGVSGLDRVDAVFLGGNGFRAAASIEELERLLALPVLSANQVLLWSARQVTGSRWPMVGCGTLFDHDADP